MKPGDKIKTTTFYERDYGGPHCTGTFVKVHRSDPMLVRVRRDGIKEIETWHRDFWEQA